MTYDEFKLYIQTSLNLSDRKVVMDRKNFSAFCNQKISINDSLKYFIENNELDREIDVDHYRRWLSSLGWREGEFDD